MAAVLIGGVIVIWLALSGGRALLTWLGVELQPPADLLAPLFLALIETVLFLLSVPAGDLLPQGQRWPLAITLTVLAWLINGAVSGWMFRRTRRPA